MGAPFTRTQNTPLCPRQRGAAGSGTPVYITQGRKPSKPWTSRMRSRAYVRARPTAATTAANSPRRNRVSASRPFVTPSARYPWVRRLRQISCSISWLSSTTSIAVASACAPLTTHLARHMLFHGGTRRASRRRFRRRPTKRAKIRRQDEAPQSGTTHTPGWSGFRAWHVRAGWGRITMRHLPDGRGVDTLGGTGLRVTHPPQWRRAGDQSSTATRSGSAARTRE